MYIRDLKCNQGHVFEWFFDSRTKMAKELSRKEVVCPVCNSTEMTQEVCGPSVKTESRTVPLHVQKQVAAYRQHVYQTAEDVGGDLFKVSKADDYKGKRILLVDDVFTTGATVNECAKVLRRAGAEEVCVLTVARGE